MSLKWLNYILGVKQVPLHIAVAAGTPTVCLMGGGHFGRFFPYGDIDKNRIVYKKWIVTTVIGNASIRILNVLKILK